MARRGVNDQLVFVRVEQVVGGELGRVAVRAGMEVDARDGAGGANREQQFPRGRGVENDVGDGDGFGRVRPQQALDCRVYGGAKRLDAAIMGLIERYAIEPAKEMEARYLMLPDAPAGTSTPERLARGMRTPEAAFVVPILCALQALGGRAQMQQVLEHVEAEMKGEFREVDHLPLKSDKNKPRWYNTAQWARNTMVEDGLLKKSSPRGIWELTAEGVRYLQRHSGK